MVARGLIAAVHGPIVTSSKRGGRVAARSTRTSHPSVPSEAGGDDVPSNKASRRAVLAAVLSTPLAAPALAVDLEALNEDIMRVADPERYNKDASKVELERQLGAPGSPVNAPGMDKGVDGERDVVTMPSGLSYADVEIGHGNKVKVGDLVVANVVGYTPDGKVFENTYTRGTALTFQLGIRPPGVCEGLEQGISTMRAGGKRLIAVPGSLGFGERGIRAPLGRVPPNSALRYEVELLRCVTEVPVGATEAGATDAAALNGERICCSDAAFPCDPIRAAEEGGTAAPMFD
jgi:FKBP-type peptidyl-prolyl cis-trans isomerase